MKTQLLQELIACITQCRVNYVLQKQETKNFQRYEETNAPKTKNQHSSIFYEEVELQELDIDQTENV